MTALFLWFSLCMFLQTIWNSRDSAEPWPAGSSAVPLYGPAVDFRSHAHAGQLFHGHSDQCHSLHAYWLVIFYEICALTGFKKKDKFPMLIIIGICYAAALGVSVLPFKPIAGVVINGVQQRDRRSDGPAAFCLNQFHLRFGPNFIIPSHR